MAHSPEPVTRDEIDHFPPSGGPLRSARGISLPPLCTRKPRRGDIYHALRSALLEGSMPSGARLPSTRQAARDYGVSRGLVETVFDQLRDEGFLERVQGSGTRVCEAVARLGQPTQERAPRGSNPISSRGRNLVANASCREPEIYVPFNAGVPDGSEFPWERWRGLEARAAREIGRRSLMFADPRGLPELRAAVASHLAQYRGIPCIADEVVIFNSIQQALNAIALLLLDRGDKVWIEDPCYSGARAAFELSGATLVPKSMDEDGLRVDQGKHGLEQARMAYVTSSHQYPLGVTLSLTRRIALLDWARRNCAWIIEDDYDGEFRYDGQLLTALRTLDVSGRVLYLGSLSKAMFVSLRLAYAVVPQSLVELLADVRTHLDGFTAPLPQRTASLFINEGYFAAHLRRMRQIYAAKYAALNQGLSPLGAWGWKWPRNPAGMHLAICHRNSNYVRRTAHVAGIDVRPLSSYRVINDSGDGLFLRFGALDLPTIHAGARALVKAARPKA